MQAVKKLEIITEALEMPAVITVLEACGVSGYTVMKDVVGNGERGLRSGDALTQVLTNHYLVTTCPAEHLQEVVEAIRPILRKCGGVCLVSDASWVLH